MTRRLSQLVKAQRRSGGAVGGFKQILFFLFFNSQKSGNSSQKVESSPKLLGEIFTNREVFEATTNTVGKLPKFFCPHDAKVMFIGGGGIHPQRDMFDTGSQNACSFWEPVVFVL